MVIRPLSESEFLRQQADAHAARKVTAPKFGTDGPNELHTRWVQCSLCARDFRVYSEQPMPVGGWLCRDGCDPIAIEQERDRRYEAERERQKRNPE